MVVPPSSAAKSVAEFIAFAKERPGKLNYGSGGVGSLAHLSAEAFRFATGIDYIHVPYKGAPDIVLGLLGEQIQVPFHHADGLPSGAAGQAPRARGDQRQAHEGDARGADAARGDA